MDAVRRLLLLSVTVVVLGKQGPPLSRRGDQIQDRIQKKSDWRARNRIEFAL